jgi:hypothetical protein
LKIHFNIILPSTPMCFKWSFSLMFPPPKNPVMYLSSPPHPYLLHVLPITFLIWWPQQYFARSRDQKAHYMLINNLKILNVLW